MNEIAIIFIGFASLVGWWIAAAWHKCSEERDRKAWERELAEMEHAS